ncbi:hypothetical protein K3495_g15244 [Podosphaera aphanis]|nr:hypothetical protein K3495_g15244 [Podosphaera aphanis]
MIKRTSRCGFVYAFRIHVLPFSSSTSHNAFATRSVSRFLTSQTTDIKSKSVVSKNELQARIAKSRQSRLIELAQKITEETEKLDRWLQKTSSPELGFGIDSPVNFPISNDEVETSRLVILKSTDELNALVKGPAECLRWMAWDVGLS